VRILMFLVHVSSKTCPTTLVNRFHATSSAEQGRCKDAEDDLLMRVPKVSYKAGGF